MEVGLNADTLHHQVLRYPGHKLLLHSLFQLLNLKKEKGGLKKLLIPPLIYSHVLSISIYLLCHVGLRKVVEDKSDLLLHILWRLDNPFCLVSGHQQGVNVGCVYGGLQVRIRIISFQSVMSLITVDDFNMQKN